MSDSTPEPKPLYKRVWIWAVGALAVIGIIGVMGGPSIMDKVNEQQAGGRQTASNSPVASAGVQDLSQPVTCESAEASDMVKGALEGSSTTQQPIKVLDFGRAEETFLDKAKKTRGCKADAELNTGSELVTYQLFFGPSGKALVRVEEGADAEAEVGLDADRKDALELASRKSAPTGTAASTVPDQSAADEQAYLDHRQAIIAAAGGDLGQANGSPANQALSASMVGKKARDWKCVIQSDGAALATDHSIECEAGPNQDTRIQIYYGYVLHPTLEANKGDQISVSGTITVDEPNNIQIKVSEISLASPPTQENK